MNGNRGFLAVFACCMACAPVPAQQPFRQEEPAEELLNNAEAGMLSGEGTQALLLSDMEDQQEILLQGIDLNTAGSDELSGSGLFTPFQVRVLIDYRERHGNLWSVYELTVLPGFRNFPVERMKPFLSVTKSIHPPSFQPNSGMVMIDAGRTFPANNAPYPGSPWQNSLRIRVRPKKGPGLAFAFDKDAGERFHQDGRPEYLAGNLTFGGKGITREVVAGNYRIRQGMGLVNGSGFMHDPAMLPVNRSSLSGLRPCASLSSTGTCTGLAIRMETDHLRILAWLSGREIDLSPGAIFAGGDPFESRRETGLHRTEGEIRGRRLGYRVHSGVQVLTWHKGLSLGALLGFGQTGLTRRGTDSLGISLSPIFFRAASVHMLWQKREMEVFGEWALREFKKPAILSGVRYSFSDFLQGTLLFYYYDPGYRGINPSAYCHGSGPENQAGMSLSIRAEPGPFLVAGFTFEHVRYPAPGYLAMVPSCGTRIRFTLQGPGRGNFLWKLNLVSRTWQRTASGEGINHLPLVTHHRLRAEFRLDHQPDRNFSWQTRLLLTDLTSTGYAAVQQFSLKGKRIMLTMQFVTFHVEEWDNRIYLYEPGPLYSFNFPALCGKGQKTTGLLTLKPRDRLSVSCRAVHTAYFDRDHIGSGNDITEGNSRWEMQVQGRLTF